MPSKIVNFVLQPRKSYFSPLETLFPESTVEQGLGNMFRLNSVGCMEGQDQHSQIDLMSVEELEKSMRFKDNRYYKNFPGRRIW